MSLDLSKSVDVILEAAKTASKDDIKAALEAEKAKPEAEQRSTLISGLEKLQEPEPETAPAKEEPALQENPALKGLKSISVRTNPEKVATGGAFYDSMQKITIRAEAVKVKRTKFITEKLASGELIED